MPISVSCPHCERNYNLADTQRGKTVRCKNCQQNFVIEAEEPSAPAADPQAPAPTKLFRPDALKRLLADEPPKKPKKQAAPLVPLLLGALLLVAVCGGFGYGVHWIFTRDQRPDAGPQFQAGPLAPRPQAPAGQPPSPDQGAMSVDRALQQLQSSDSNVRKSAAEWLKQAPLIPSRKTEVARALARPISPGGGQGELVALAGALGVWGIEESVRPLIDLVGHGDRGVRAAALAALSRLQPPPAQAAEPIARLLPSHPDRGEASKALEALGPVAEKAVLVYFNHPDSRTQAEARKLIQGYGTKDSAIFAQATADLNDRERRTAAVGWLGNPAVLSKFKDQLQSEHLAEQVADVLRTARDRAAAKDVLKVMGPAAEKPVVKLLDSGDRFVLEAACDVLAVIGTAASLDPLKQLAARSKLGVKRAAEGAIGAIMKRS